MSSTMEENERGRECHRWGEGCNCIVWSQGRPCWKDSIWAKCWKRWRVQVMWTPKRKNVEAEGSAYAEVLSLTSPTSSPHTYSAPPSPHINQTLVSLLLLTYKLVNGEWGIWEAAQTRRSSSEVAFLSNLKTTQHQMTESDIRQTNTPLEQRCPKELSAMMRMFSICAVQ